ncbi:MAG: DUF2997 domain-containing protein [Eubacteriales bacterium]|nr:DUF2997 domain-containing protein [Eubacteriales bacterium]
MTKIIFKIQKDGTVEMHTEGLKDGSCHKYAALLAQELDGHLYAYHSLEESESLTTQTVHTDMNTEHLVEL